MTRFTTEEIRDIVGLQSISDLDAPFGAWGDARAAFDRWLQDQLAFAWQLGRSAQEGDECPYGSGE